MLSSFAASATARAGKFCKGKKTKSRAFSTGSHSCRCHCDIARRPGTVERSRINLEAEEIGMRMRAKGFELPGLLPGRFQCDLQLIHPVGWMHPERECTANARLGREQRMNCREKQEVLFSWGLWSAIGNPLPWFLWRKTGRRGFTPAQAVGGPTSCWEKRKERG